MSRTTLTSYLFITSIVICMLIDAATAGNLRVYFVGNSLSDGMGLSDNPEAWDKRDMLQRFVADSGANSITIGSCNSAGAPLSWNWNENPHTTLATNAWDVLSLQPYDRMLYDANWQSHAYDWGAVTNAKYFIEEALINNTNIQVYVYSHWPDIPNHKRHADIMAEINPDTGINYTWEEAEDLRQQARDDFEAAGGWDGHWDDLYTNPNGFSNNRTRDFFEQLLSILNNDRLQPGDRIAGLNKKIRMVPVGDVLYEIHQRLKTDPTLLPRAVSAGGGYYTNVLQFHSDVPHLAPGCGRFIGVATWYATLYHANPKGLDYTIYNDSDPNDNQYHDYGDPYYEEVTEDFANAVCDIAWEVVSMHPYAGVRDSDADTDGLPDWWEMEHFGSKTVAAPGAAASNRINTLREAYIAGVDPNSALSAFSVKGIVQHSPPTISWDGVSGRSYAISWSSNLSSAFSVIASNISWSPGEYTDHTDRGAAGFYKVKVNLAE